MNVYDVDTVGYSTDVYSVVAEDMAMAERLFKEAYSTSTIKKITLHSSYVLVQRGER